MDSASPLLNLPNGCWDCICKLLTDTNNEGFEDYNHVLKSLSVISKKFLSITSSLRFSLTISKNASLSFFCRDFQRFTNLTSLDFTLYNGCLNTVLCHLSRFSLNLTSLNLSNKPTIPANGLRVLSRNITTLTSLTCSNIESINSTDIFLIADCFPFLEELDLSNPKEFNNLSIFFDGVEALSLALFKLRKVNLSNHNYINDKLLFHLLKNCKHLEEVIMFKCSQLTKAGIASALWERPTLRSLSFTDYFDQDCAKLYAFIRNFPSLSEIKVEFKCMSVESLENASCLVDFGVRPQLKSLSLIYNCWLSNENLEMLSSLFPNLQLLDLSHCYDISEEGICQVLKRCCEIRDLNLAYCPRVGLSGMNFEISKLEVLNLSHTRVDDKTLYAISKSCCGLLQLLLENCRNVTGKGVMDVVKNCTQLTEVNLRRCYNVHPDVVDSMIFSRPSLRKIIVPPWYNKKRNLVLPSTLELL
ncbi:putative leucine-rich repeat domain, L domain-containing protein [Medicago truncatula]|uniref:F-box/RNI superfamily protein n=1 Tax=Medicago truncatula TaxID=3880 RepID=G7J164_MEDTR|nr:F-box/LRR-repeat protein 2 [Medicago truncatula]AES87317.1 F-box/RNI superfamily protein [Medicago truncatula]RHN59238.1 putative leucine-rich repeat domain, L domain-containing protein [Medicago truncatula]